MKVEQLLMRYPAYKHAVTAYENHQPMPAAAIANYSSMPSGSGAPELFFACVGKPADMGFTSFEDYTDYLRYKRVTVEIEGALGTLPERAQTIVRLKWMHSLTFRQISQRKNCSEKTVRVCHRIAMDRLHDALRFTKLEEIHYKQR